VNPGEFHDRRQRDQRSGHATIDTWDGKVAVHRLIPHGAVPGQVDRAKHEMGEGVHIYINGKRVN
jgi:hypothetical protein